MPDNYLIILSGRGVLYAGMIAAASLEELANRCKRSTDQGFEVYIYSLRLSPSTATTVHFPEGATPLKREYLLYDAHELFEERTNSIINELADHCFAAQKQYLEATVARLQKELEQVNNDIKSVEGALTSDEEAHYPTENTNTHSAEELPPDGVTNAP